jgi:hypothetical protein
VSDQVSHPYKTTGKMSVFLQMGLAEVASKEIPALK